ncbi:hypothetical protein PUN28_013097 [Cardiocondyla obscurior]|uniref:Uncharacterized protein n=1 Tax=Cardiocondyla obscurior TaxID=286306 RepID=A0AAW2FA16_9HYME
MRITCLITVCAYLSSIASSDEVQYLNRLKRVKSHEELIIDDATVKNTARKDLNLNTEVRPNVFSTLRKSRPQGKIENFQKPYQKKSHESHLNYQQQQPRDRLKRPIKRLKVRSIPGSTYDVVEDNEIHEIIQEPLPEVHEEGPIYIKPVVRVTKKGVLDSIIDILGQLLNPPKKELGPIVGPIKMPGSNRKIYLRLMEPVDASHINVRFVTQVPVPVVDEESLFSGQHESILPFLPYSDPDATLLHKHIGSDATFSSSNRHPSVQLPRNVTHVSGKGRAVKPATKYKSPSQELKETDKENVPPVKVEAASVTEVNKNHYYHYQSADEAVKQVTDIIKNATESEQDTKSSVDLWHQGLTTHQLPLRQIAPLYPLSAMDHTSSASYENTYKVPSDSLTVPSPQSSTYEQYANDNSGASEVYDHSSYTIPSTYAATTYHKQNEFSNAPSSYPISYQNQNEYSNAPSSTSYAKQNDLYNPPTTHTSLYEKPANVPPPSSAYATPYEVQSTAQVGSSSQNALRIIEPPHYFHDPRKVPESSANKIFEKPEPQAFIQPQPLVQLHPVVEQQPYDLPNVNEISSLVRNTAPQDGQLVIDQVTWGKVKREKSESNSQRNELNFQKSVEIVPDDNREKWQPLTFVGSEDADWHKALANLAKVAANTNYHEVLANGNYHEVVAKHQPVNRPRQASRTTTPESTIETGRELSSKRQNSKRRNQPAASTSSSRCHTSDKGVKCERTEPILPTVSTPYPEGTVKIIEEQTQTSVVESIAITPKPTASYRIEKSRANATVKSSWAEEPQPLIMTTELLVASSTTAKSPILIKAIKNTPEKSIESKSTGSSTSSATEKLAASSSTERSLISGTSKVPVSRNNTKRAQLPKRPMVMKKPTFVFKEKDLSSTTRRPTTSSSTWKPTTAGTTEKIKIARRQKFKSAALRTKSSAT